MGEKCEVIEKARKDGTTVRFAALMDLCHLKKSEMEHKFQNYKDRVVFRSDVVKYESGSYAVFTEEEFVIVTNDGRESSGFYRQTTWLRKTRKRRW